MLRDVKVTSSPIALTPRDVTDKSSGISVGQRLMFPRRRKCWASNATGRSVKFQMSAFGGGDWVNVAVWALRASSFPPTSPSWHWAIVFGRVRCFPPVVVFSSSSSSPATSTSGFAQLTSSLFGWRSIGAWWTPSRFLSSCSVSVRARSDFRHRARRFWNQTWICRINPSIDRISGGWSGRLEQSPTGHSFLVYIINFQKHAQDTSFLTFLLHWLFPEYEQRTLYGALVVTLAMLLRVINCRFIIIIISSSSRLAISIVRSLREA